LWLIKRKITWELIFKPSFHSEQSKPINPFIAALKSHEILYIGAPWPHGLQKRLNPFIAALKSHEITLHWYGRRPWAGSASELKKIGRGTEWVDSD
jgi:hypothetical protein